ncbi:5-methylcytosine restriction system specificity protein McrC [Sphingobacterium hotanense]|uniref:5-methylcytosine restriction system specificity protein McrC n=1 Tax=Sphingobacterium hotanense TaxID=649196 RepID=UPI0011F22262|nr:restriction endonuclease [Sphingobacterium hotanense]
MGIRLSEHRSYFIRLLQDEELLDDSTQVLCLNASEFERYQNVVSKSFNKSSYRFLFGRKDSFYEIKADYCIGIDWLGNTGRNLYVEPKLNTTSAEAFNQQLDQEEDGSVRDSISESGVFCELDYLKMLLKVTSVRESNVEVKDLVQIDWDVEQIPIDQKDDRLTPFLIVRFLQTLKSIVRKGLKKNYYKVQENLNNRIKGKILVGQHIKQNIYKNRFTATYCKYQVFGEDHIENRFLKKVLRFVISYVENHKVLLSSNYKVLQETIRYCRPAFELISDDVSENELNQIKHNPFYKDYKEAIHIGNHILKRFAFNITKTSSEKVATPPFWIDMPRLFEMYVFSKMIEDNPDSKRDILYQFSTYGNALDILVSKDGYQMVIDAKYKLHYQNSHLHQDIRQVAGYARLNKVRDKLNVTDDSNVDCLIIYPDIKNGTDDFTLVNIIDKREPIKVYHKVYKLGVKLPLIS